MLRKCEASVCKNWISVSALLCPLGPAGSGQLVRTPAVTSGLSRRLEPGGQAHFLWPFASRPGLGRGPRSVARDVPSRPIPSASPALLPRKARRPPPQQVSPPWLSPVWVGSWLEGGGPGRGATFLPWVFCLGRESELPLFLYNKPVAWWGNLRVAQMTAAGPGQKCPHCEGAALPLEGLDGGSGELDGHREVTGEWGRGPQAPRPGRPRPG